MITCETARPLLLEAEPTELRGEGDGEVAAHVRGCARCAAHARYILEQQDTLARALRGLRSSADAGRAPVRARRRAARPVYHRWEALVPLALAAGAAGLLLARRQSRPPTGAPLQIATTTAPALDVQVPAGQSVAVFQTANPNVVVIWSY